jgi:hypothetical protein
VRTLTHMGRGTPEEFDRPPTGWFALDVMRRKPQWDWVALMVDVHPDDLKHCACDFRRASTCIRMTIGRRKAVRRANATFVVFWQTQEWETAWHAIQDAIDGTLH